MLEPLVTIVIELMIIAIASCGIVLALIGFTFLVQALRELWQKHV